MEFIEIVKVFYYIKTKNTAVGMRCADQAALSIRKSWH
jgi:hypothetical protein